jgi:hypothetical protein
MKTHFPISINKFKDIYDVAYLVKFEVAIRIQYGPSRIWTNDFGQIIKYDLFLSMKNYPIKLGVFKDISIIEVFGEI